MRGVWSSCVTLAVAGVLAGCAGGGGGGGGGSPSGGGGGSGGGGASLPSPSIGNYTRTGAPDYTAEANRNYGLAAIGALQAQAANQTGAGITVGVIDTGIDLNHPDFAGAISPSSTNILTGNYADTQGVGGHGTMVAGIIGARKDGYDGLGVAPGATILAVRSDTPGTCPNNCSFNDSDLATAVNYAVAHGAKIINLSLGGAAISDDFKTALANATAQGVIIAAAAGNTGGANPIDPAKSLAGAIGNGIGLAVGAVDQNNQLAWFSNMAGGSASHYLVAPGVSITATALGGGTATGSGTSFATPQVAGAAAVVWGASPFLTAQQVVNLLLTTATNLGDQTIYGQGLINIPAALQPQGQQVVATGSSVAQGGAPIQSTQITPGAAFGDALSLRVAPALANAVTFDSYGRPFMTDLSGSVHALPSVRNPSDWIRAGGTTTATQVGATSLTLTTPPPQLEQAVHSAPGQADQAQPSFALTTDLGGGNRVGVARGLGLDRLTGLAATTPEAASPGITGDALGSPYLALAGGGTAFTAGRDLGDGLQVTMGFGEDGGGPLGDLANPGLPSQPRRGAALAETTQRWRDGTTLGVQVGRLSEQAGPLASYGDGAFAFDRAADTLFLGLFGSMPWDRQTTLFGRWGWGSTAAASFGDGLLRADSAIQTQSFALGAARRDALTDGDRLTFTLAQPLRVTAGSATLTVPVGRTMDGTVISRGTRIDLTPSGSETDLELGWTTRPGPGELTLGGGLMLDPGNVAGAGPGVAAGAKYRLNW